jgi:tetratricopeptide (TPR) repeat protein
MPRGCRTFSGIIVLAFAARSQTAQSASAVCSDCHPAIAQSYRSTGMARSFFRPAPGNKIEDYSRPPYYHSASDTWFEMIERGGKYFQRQYQIGLAGCQTNATETGIDFVIGSGSHARTYLHRTPNNQLMELPLGWYAEAGGYWAMNPGYDRPDHAGLSRAVPYQCMFCHNGYPQIPAGQGPRAGPVFLSVPQGIDCQRCHGAGEKHVQLARTAGVPVEEMRKAIVNPARLPAGRQLEVCLQCHLEPNSASTSSLLVRYEREPFSFKPGEPLSDFRLHFDQSGDKDRFEIVGSAAYRLMQSQCFLKSGGAMTCTTCHDPHKETPPRQYAETCAQCHAAKVAALIRAQRHPASTDCAGCHMPKRRTGDAVHVVMTDHRIQRTLPARDLLAPLRDEVHPDTGGEITPSYPPSLAVASDELYLGVAQLSAASTRTEGIARLSAAIRKFRPAAAEYYLQLGDALRASRRFSEAIAPYEEAVRREPQSAAAHERLAFGLTRVRQFARADAEFSRALELAPADAALLKDAGISLLEQGRMPEAASMFRKSLAIDDGQYEAHNGLGGALLKTGDSAAAEAEFRKAIQLRPHYAEAHHNLAWLLSSSGRLDEAEYHFEESLRINANNIETHFDYAVMLDRAGQPEKEIRQLAIVLRANARHAKARDLLEKAAGSGDAAIRAEARKLLETIR